MPARNALKEYIEDGHYHLYNRGVEKRIIFLNEQDYGVFLGYLKEYLLPKDENGLQKRLTDPSTPYQEKDKILKTLRLNNFNDEITLLAYCLMPNHFHLMVKQKSPESIDVFIQSLCTRYTMYFNRKYKRVGSLFQSVYKAVRLVTDEQFLHLSRYIHKQALASQGETLQGQPSSYPEYIKQRRSNWIHTEPVLAHFNTRNPLLSYETFVKQPDDLEILSKIKIENNT